MKFLFFDTETTGLPKNYKAPYTDTNNWPRIVQLSWIVSEDSQILKESDNIIKVDFPIPKSSSDIHGITNEVSTSKGEVIDIILDKWLDDIKDVDMIVCHNLSFDLTVLQAELLRANKNPEFEKKMFCTMKSSVNYCKLPGLYGFKWPKLEELYGLCFDERLENAHNAMIDVQATFRVFDKLKKEKVFTF
jgi:DNA polymerase III subunit epsilon